MINKEEITEIGKFQKTHALKGELNMISEIDPEYFLDGNPLILEYDGILVPFYVETVRPKGSTSYLVKLEGINSENEASGFVNKTIYILKKDAQDWLNLEEEDLNGINGFTVIDRSTGKEVGKVMDIDDSTSNILLILESNDGETFYIPLNDDFIEEIDEEKKIIIMKLPEGLLDINL